MTSFLDKLNLRPQERRLVVIVGIIVFVVLNLLLVWPHFGEFARIQQRQRDETIKLRRFQEELRKEPEYKRELTRLQAMGEYVATEQQGLELMREVQAQAALNGVNVQRWDPRTGPPRTNSFFEEAVLNITMNTGEKELVNFLYSLSSTGSLTRVRTLTLQRDPSQMRLAGTISFVKSFQRKPPPKSAAPAKPPPPVTGPGIVKAKTPAVKPATNPPAKPVLAAKTSLPSKSGSATNAPGSLAKSKGQDKTPASTNWFKRLFSKWFSS